MKYSLMVRSRPNLAQTIQEKHDSFVSCLGPDGWGFEKGEYPPAPDLGHQLVAVVQLRNYLRKGTRGRLSYSLRSAGSDEAMYDDYCTIEFNPNRLDYSSVPTEFQTYVECFSAYRGEIIDVDCYELDFEKSRGVDARRGVVRIAPICFFDRELCLRSFRLTPEAIVDRLEADVEQVRLVCDGVLIIATSRIFSVEQANAIDNSLRSLLS